MTLRTAYSKKRSTEMAIGKHCNAQCERIHRNNYD